MKNKNMLGTATTRHQIYLQRVASHEALTFDDYLKESDKIIRDVLSKTTLSTTRQMNAATVEIRKRLTVNYTEWARALYTDLEVLGGVEAEFTTQMLIKATVNTAVGTPTVAAVFAAAEVIPVQINVNGQSKSLLNFVDDFTPNEVARINGVIRNGFYNNQPVANIVRSIRGTRANRFKDGILEITRRSAQVIARTSVNHVASAARMTTLKKNSRVMDGWTFSATLDSKTTTTCRHYDGENFPIGQGPMPPLHVSCRSAIRPNVKPSLTPFTDDGTRASVGASGGKQTKRSPYYDFLRGEPEDYQRKVLGRTKTKLFRDGGMSNDEFRKLTVNHMGKPLTIPEMRALNPEAFARAGLD